HRILGDLPAILMNDLLCCAMKVTRAAIIAKPLPESEDVLFVSCGKIGNCRKGLEKAVEVGNHRCYLGLLQHDLADPDAIGIAIAAPGKIAARMFKPTEERALKPATQARGRKFL